MNMFGGLKKHFKGFDSWINRLRFAKLSININIYIYIYIDTHIDVNEGWFKGRDGWEVCSTLLKKI